MLLDENTKDSQLVKAFQQGNVGAFDIIFKKYSNKLYGFALGYLKSKEEAEGLVQDTFLKIWENKRKLRAESSLKSYMFTIAYHLICRNFRSKKIHNVFLQEKDWVGTDILNLQERLEYKSLLEQVEKLIDALPERQKIIFLKSRKEGKSSKEIAEEMNLAPGTVDNNISAALKFLRSRIHPRELTLFLCFIIQFQ